MKKYKRYSFFLYILLPIVISNFHRVQATTVICGNKDDIVDIDEDHQEAILNEKELECLTRQSIEKEFLNFSQMCETTWDLISCWPNSAINKTIELLCPDYVDKFNMKNKAIKHCYYDFNTATAEWSKTNYSLCVEPIACDERCDLEGHMKYIIIIRICGYVASMFSLTLSIFILLRPKLRCPRNYVHINLFSAFAVRTVLVMLVDLILNNKSSLTDTDLNSNPTPQPTISQSGAFHKVFVLCKIMMATFRYSGSVYHVAIFGEALYLVLLLKFPYYSERKGALFCILLSWFLPVVWMLPWVLVRLLIDNFWCWNHDSSWNLIIKIPHSLLLVLNICCAIFIIRILYSKMRSRSMSREKLLKYRRLAKSILILIPIFGLHFIFFAWLPYAELVGLELGPCFEIIATYIETFFNAFQGLVVSITSCFIHGEVKVEIILFSCELLKKIKCFQSLDCLESDYIFQLRYAQTENRYMSGTGSRSKHIHAHAHRSLSNNLDDRNNYRHRTTSNNKDLSKIVSIDEEEEEFKLVQNDEHRTKRSKLSKSRSLSQIDKETRKSSAETNLSMVTEPVDSRCCSFLFTNQQNDFFTDNRKKTSNKTKKGSENRTINKRKETNNITLLLDKKTHLNEEIKPKNAEKINICLKCNQINSNNACKCGELVLNISNC